MARSVTGKALAALALLACVADAAVAQQANLPAGMEGLRGRHWRGGECCGWTWDWVQQNGPVFRGAFRNPNGQRLEEQNIIISIFGDRVQITRANGSAAGGCTYDGVIRGGSAEGTYACAGRDAGKWAATIYQSAPR
ncbi:hypothetical protein LJR289_005974 [Pseudoduganella sp. LjRoot289]|uniref:hypothetical protein n=1 Tax=Pseudoduganella sp. LjRoot289 TaxID=3342314 RepID=UPI003ECD1979